MIQPCKFVLTDYQTDIKIKKIPMHMLPKVRANRCSDSGFALKFYGRVLSQLAKQMIIL